MRVLDDVDAAPLDLALPEFTGGRGPITYEVTVGEPTPAFVTVEYDEATSGITFPSETYTVELDAATGEISGVTGYPGVFTGTVTVSDALGGRPTADSSLTFDLTLVYLDAPALEAPETDFTFVREVDGGDPPPIVVFTGDQVRVSGLNPGALPDDGSMDLLFVLTCVSARDYDTGDLAPDCGTSWAINEADGTISRVATSDLGTYTFDVGVTHGPSGSAAEYRLNLTASTYTGTVGP